jgi:hypothetical protein
MAMTRAQMNKKIRQEALREQLSSQGHVQHVVDSIDKLEQLDEELDSTQVQRIRAAIDSRLKLVDKYLPSLKSVELTGDEDNPVAISAYEIRFSDEPDD